MSESTPSRLFNLSRLRELLLYDPDTGIFRWRKHRGGRALANSIAGYKRHDGYYSIVIDLKSYYAHRLAWLYIYGTWPPDGIDHINNNPSDNRISNLRPATQCQNLLNSRKRKDNNSGYKGVSWSTRDKTWKAFISRNKQRKSLGSFESAKEAYEVYLSVAQLEENWHFWREE